MADQSPPGAPVLPAFPIPIHLWTVTEFEHRITSSLVQPFAARGIDSEGRVVSLCVKPLVPGRGADGYMAAAELLGAVIGSILGVPVAEPGLAWVSPAFLASVAPALHDVIAGWAVATRWVPQAFSAAGMDQRTMVVVNAESVAGVTVLDTLIDNHDRAGNILLQPMESSPREFALRYIDHGLGLGGSAQSLLGPSASEADIQCRAPEDDAICALVDRQESFFPYLVAAEALPLTTLRKFVDTAQAIGWGLPSSYGQDVIAHLNAASRHVRSVVLRSLSLFPKCV